jgi:hypothetical protein
MAIGIIAGIATFRQDWDQQKKDSQGFIPTR